MTMVATRPTFLTIQTVKVFTTSRGGKAPGPTPSPLRVIPMLSLLTGCFQKLPSSQRLWHDHRRHPWSHPLQSNENQQGNFKCWFQELNFDFLVHRLTIDWRYLSSTSFCPSLSLPWHARLIEYYNWFKTMYSRFWTRDEWRDMDTQIYLSEIEILINWNLIEIIIGLIYLPSRY